MKKVSPRIQHGRIKKVYRKTVWNTSFSYYESSIKFQVQNQHEYNALKSQKHTNCVSRICLVS